MLKSPTCLRMDSLCTILTNSSSKQRKDAIIGVFFLSNFACGLLIQFKCNNILTVLSRLY
jgi:ABC-type Mn2+/Zn2+ transport system permease subunit